VNRRVAFAGACRLPARWRRSDGTTQRLVTALGGEVVNLPAGSAIDEVLAYARASGVLRQGSEQIVVLTLRELVP
jgi:hypothetical protein